MSTECCGKNITVNVCSCCDCSKEKVSGVIKETVLYDQVIDKIGEYQLYDDINNFDDIYIMQRYIDSGYYGQGLYVPIKYLKGKTIIYESGSNKADVNIAFNNSIMNITSMDSRYQITTVIGRKYN